jgi:hypothetical protein
MLLLSLNRSPPASEASSESVLREAAFLRQVRKVSRPLAFAPLPPSSAGKPFSRNSPISFVRFRPLFQERPLQNLNLLLWLH